MKYKINKGFISQKMGDTITIFSGEDSLLFTLNETASYIFKSIKSGNSDDRIIAGLVKKFGAPEKTAKTDLENFIKLMLKKKIISEVE